MSLGASSRVRSGARGKESTMGHTAISNEAERAGEWGPRAAHAMWRRRRRGVWALMVTAARGRRTAPTHIVVLCGEETGEGEGADRWAH
jgi:hypothetical protein